MEQFDWAEDIEGAVTVCDAEGVVVYMNKRSRETFNKDGRSMVGQSLMPCHNERSQAIIRDMLEQNKPKCHTTTGEMAKSSIRAKKSQKCLAFYPTICTFAE